MDKIKQHTRTDKDGNIISYYETQNGKVIFKDHFRTYKGTQYSLSEVMNDWDNGNTLCNGKNKIAMVIACEIADIRLVGTLDRFRLSENIGHVLVGIWDYILLPKRLGLTEFIEMNIAMLDELEDRSALFYHDFTGERYTEEYAYKENKFRDMFISDFKQRIEQHLYERYGFNKRNNCVHGFLHNDLST